MKEKSEGEGEERRQVLIFCWPYLRVRGSRRLHVKSNKRRKRREVNKEERECKIEGRREEKCCKKEVYNFKRSKLVIISPLKGDQMLKYKIKEIYYIEYTTYIVKQDPLMKMRAAPRKLAVKPRKERKKKGEIAKQNVLHDDDRYYRRAVMCCFKFFVAFSSISRLLLSFCQNSICSLITVSLIKNSKILSQHPICHHHLPSFSSPLSILPILPFLRQLPNRLQLPHIQIPPTEDHPNVFCMCR